MPCLLMLLLALTSLPREPSLGFKVRVGVGVGGFPRVWPSFWTLFGEIGEMHPSQTRQYDLHLKNRHRLALEQISYF